VASSSPATDKSAQQVITAWRPRSVGPEAAGFARQVVAASSPLSPDRARSLLWACSRLAVFGDSVGLQLEAAVLLRPSVIERFVLVGLQGTSPGRRATVRSNLRSVGRAVVPSQFPPDPLAIGRWRAKEPYRAGEIAAYLQLADAQSTLARRMRAGGLICLGAGAGVVGTDLRNVRGQDVHQAAGIIVVEVKGRRARTVPVSDPYAERLVAAACFAGEGFVIGGVSAERHNVTNRLVTRLSGGQDLGRLDVGRLRATWLVNQIGAFGLKELLQAAGVSDSKQIFDLCSNLPAPCLDDVIAAFHDSCAPRPG
jgi:integrase